MHQRAYSMGGVLQAKFAIVLACAVLILAGWAVTLERIHYEHGNAIADAVRQNGNLAVAFEEQTLRTIWAADQALIFLRQQYQEHGRIADLRAQFDAGLLDNALIPNYLVINAEGRMLAKDGAVSEVDVSDRDFFIFLRSATADRLFISKPFTGRVTGRAVIAFSRRMTRSDGSFAGVVSVGLDPAYFLNTYRSLDLGAQGLIQLVGLDGIARARRIGKEASLGQDMRESELLKRAAAEPAGSFLSPGTWSNGVQRYLSYRVLRDYGLVVAVGTSEEEVLAEFAGRARRYYIGATLGTSLILLFAAGLLAAQARRDKAEAERRAAESRYRATFDEAAVGVAHIDLNGRYLKANRKLCELLGREEAELLGRGWPEVTHPDDVKGSEDRLRTMLADPAARVPEFEKRYCRKDGTEVWGGVSVALVRDRQARPDYFVSVVQDITARKQAEAQLLEQLDELRRFQKVSVDRELRMMELEAEVRALRATASA